MHYVEMLRARRVLFWYGIVLLGMLLILIVTVLSSKSAHFENHSGVPFSGVLGGAVLGAWIVTTCVAPGLNAEGMTIPITWTRPLSRTLIAWRFVLVDFAAIAIGYTMLVAAILICFTVFGLLPQMRWDAASFQAVFLGLGTAVMWYGLVLVVTARMSGRGALFAGLSWAAFLIIGGVWAAPLPAPIHYAVWGLNYLNPIAYLGGVSSGSRGNVHHPIVGPEYVRAIGAWAIAALSITLAVRLWSTREV